MLATTARLLELLEMLQERPVTAGGEIAGRLAVDRRTVRRYIAALQALGIPVEGERGAGGGFDAVGYVSRSLARVPWAWQVEVLLHAPPQEVAPCLPAALAELAADGDGTLLRMRVDSLDWMAGILAGLGCDFTVRAPAELRAGIRALADRLARSA